MSIEWIRPVGTLLQIKWPHALTYIQRSINYSRPPLATRWWQPEAHIYICMGAWIKCGQRQISESKSRYKSKSLIWNLDFWSFKKISLLIVSKKMDRCIPNNHIYNLLNPNKWNAICSERDLEQEYIELDRHFFWLMG